MAQGRREKRFHHRVAEDTEKRREEIF